VTSSLPGTRSRIEAFHRHCPRRFRCRRRLLAPYAVDRPHLLYSVSRPAPPRRSASGRRRSPGLVIHAVCSPATWHPRPLANGHRAAAADGHRTPYGCLGADQVTARGGQRCQRTRPGGGQHLAHDEHEPGTHFAYNPVATYLASAAAYRQHGPSAHRGASVAAGRARPAVVAHGDRGQLTSPDPPTRDLLAAQLYLDRGFAGRRVLPAGKVGPPARRALTVIVRLAAGLWLLVHSNPPRVPQGWRVWAFASSCRTGPPYHGGDPSHGQVPPDVRHCSQPSTGEARRAAMRTEPPLGGRCQRPARQGCRGDWCGAVSPRRMPRRALSRPRGGLTTAVRTAPPGESDGSGRGGSSTAWNCPVARGGRWHGADMG
jgi:hypothetical protein